MPRLSVCLIARNEAAYLARCLESVRDLADEIIVADTGSTDETVAIARSFGATVIDFAWVDDFAAARNFVLDHASGDWVLSIDADETIAARDHALIRQQIQRTDLDAVTAFQRHYLIGTVIGWQAGDGGYDEGKPYPGYFDVECRRVFRRAPWLRWRNRVHEELISVDPGRPLVQTPGGWIIHHFGKVGDEQVLRAKGEAYLRIGEKKIQDQPGDPQAHYEQGLAYGELGRNEEALACFERTLQLSPRYRDARLRVGLCLRRLGRSDEALAALRVAARELPEHAATIAFEEGNTLRTTGDDPGAEQAFRKALATDPSFAPAAINLALVHQRAGRTDDALAAVEAALKHSPAHPVARRMRARYLAQQHRFDDARAALDGLDDSRDAEVATLRGIIALAGGNLAEAQAQLRRSLAVKPNGEAALNLSLALEKRGDAEGSLAAAAQAVDLAPDAQEPLNRFVRLTGDTLARRARSSTAGVLTVFFYQPRSVLFDGRTPRERGLGGTESAIVYLAEALARLGHRVVVLNHCETPTEYQGVEYARWETLATRALADRPDVLVGVRYWQLIGRARLAPLQLLWTGDAFDQPFLEGLADPAARAQIDFLMLQSDWQASTFQAAFGPPSWRILRTRLGPAATADTAAQPPAPGRRPRKLAYASTPFRGLDVLLEAFPAIRAACPDAELDVFSSMGVYGLSAAEDEKQFGALYAKASQPGVNLVGSLPQPELARRLEQVRVLAYPNHFAETFCIAAIEAQAAGCAVVTSTLGALPETVGEGGVCIAEQPGTPAFQKAFVDECVRLLTDEDAWHRTSERAIERAWGTYGWPAIAAGWDATLRSVLAEEPPMLERVKVHLTNGRAALALKMLQRDPAPGSVPPSAWKALTAFAAWQAGEGAAVPDTELQEIALRFPTMRATIAAVTRGTSKSQDPRTN